MKEELTREIIEEVSCCEGDCYECLALKHCYHGGNLMQKLATALLEEMDKPKVWDGAPEDTIQAQITWFTENGGFTGIKTYNRELPKTRIDEIADEVWHEINKGVTGLPKDIIKRGLKKYAKELGEK